MTQKALPGEKFCLFCAALPSGKTKEHVVPRWLLRMTGKPGLCGETDHGLATYPERSRFDTVRLIEIRIA
jgi:hypothetical protein